MVQGPSLRHVLNCLPVTLFSYFVIQFNIKIFEKQL